MSFIDEHRRTVAETTAPEWPREPLIDRLDRCLKMLSKQGTLGVTVTENAKRRLRFLRETGD